MQGIIAILLTIAFWILAFGAVCKFLKGTTALILTGILGALAGTTVLCAFSTLTNLIEGFDVTTSGALETAGAIIGTSILSPQSYFDYYADFTSGAMTLSNFSTSVLMVLLPMAAGVVAAIYMKCQVVPGTLVDMEDYLPVILMALAVMGAGLAADIVVFLPVLVIEAVTSIMRDIGGILGVICCIAVFLGAGSCVKVIVLL